MRHKCCCPLECYIACREHYMDYFNRCAENGMAPWPPRPWSYYADNWAKDHRRRA